MKIKTTRFGEIEIGDEHLIHFSDGMVGFSALKSYVLVESQSMPLVLWLQSTDSAEIAFPLIEPWFFKRDYKAPLGDADKYTLAYEEGDTLKLFVVMTIPEDMSGMTVNLKAPVAIDIQKATAAQVILQDKSLEVRTPAHEAFTRALSNFTVSQSASQAAQDFNDDIDTWTAVNVRKRTSQLQIGA